MDALPLPKLLSPTKYSQFLFIFHIPDKIFTPSAHNAKYIPNILEARELPEENCEKPSIPKSELYGAENRGYNMDEAGTMEPSEAIVDCEGALTTVAEARIPSRDRGR